MTTTYENEVRVAIAIQKIGKATPEEILEKLTSEEIKITIKKIQKACINLQKRGIISLGYDNESGYAQKAYSMAKAIFQRDIPIAHYQDLVDTSDPEIKKLIEELEEKKGTSKGKLPDIRDYYLVSVEFEVLDKVLGFMPFKEEGFNQHYYDGKNYYFLGEHFRAWIRDNARIDNKTDSIKKYIGFDKGIVTLNGAVEIVQFPVIDGGQGRGIIKYEVIPAGSTISTRFRVPGTMFTQEEFKQFLINIGDMPIKSFGGRSMTGYGRLKLKSFVIK